mmetsp:Transcript_34564/g.75689  ORF Transcript_34564/g.75689 Transcript_34564/m.75689 type:complete len:324 (-) Transcript_34564:239-1210(-)|eukprot:CAMPEP_0204272756 /NCGR_PEP_ID=MMETSP0468-20130131/22260_1 /ASSEMBLY_ACC=CAM_ASM_000383 /TAXON_ID=2969 /ORGANISM="Oxyrrhis marina" /LENGTH=323 /DNA_ID=CAMNT_0051248631 /DNA_START=72 /DNA_END=1043 /DNA_ORIENTATION=-
MADLQTIKLANGVEMPSLGFGCAFGYWSNGAKAEDDKQVEMFRPDEAWRPLQLALKTGWKHFDAALIYGTHRHLGVTLGMKFADGSLERKDVFITTKVFHPPAPFSLNTQGKTIDFQRDTDIRSKIKGDIERSLDELGVGYVDLLLMHWPGEFNTTDEAVGRQRRKECWEVFEEALAMGRTRAIGVSNFTQKHLETFLQDVKVAPMCNQIEVSPYFTRDDLRAYCKEKGIVVVAWGPFGSGATGVLTDDVIKAKAEKYKKNVGQVILRWMLQLGIAALPKSSSESRMLSNLDVFDFEISEEDMKEMGSLNKDISSAATPDSIA